TPYDTAEGGDYVVRRGETLWGIASAMRPDSRLTMNQTMLAIFEANPGAFGGNINLLREDARLRVPSADEIYRIDRGQALSEVQRQNSSWDGTPAVSTRPTPEPVETERSPSLTLVPPDEEPVGVGTGTDDSEPYSEPVSREQEILDRIAAIEAADVPEQRSLIEIRNNELATLRRELAEIRGEVYEPVDEVVPDSDDPFVADDQPADDAAGLDDIMADDTAVDAAVDDAAADTADAAADTAPAEPAATTTRRSQPEPSLVDKALGWLTSIWAIIGGALLVALGVLFWFMRRGSGDDEPEAWGRPLDADEADDDLGGTESMRAPTRDDDSFVVVEQGGKGAADTVEVPRVSDDTAETGSFGSLEDTFSSDTAINLDQSDPIAEADFHMAYGLYDQAADLINGALEVEPERQDLLTKLCEIYFVWGNRDAFIDAAERLQTVTGGDSPDWDKTVIMGQQIASDHAMFAGAGVAAATREVDLSFDGGGDDDGGALDMDFGDGAGGDDVIDLGAGDDDDGVDFLFDDTAAGEADDASPTIDSSVTSEMPTVEQPSVEPTVEMPSADSTVETPTIEEPAPNLEGTSELPSIDDDTVASGQASDATAEINLDDLGLDLDGLDDSAETQFGDDDATELASLDDLDETGTREALTDTGSITGKNPQVDPNATGVQERIDPDNLGFDDLGLDDGDDTREMRLAPDETGQNPMMDPMEATDTSIDESLLDATGKTQVLSEDMAVDTFAPDNLGDDDATMLAQSIADDDDFDFAKTEALPPDAYGGDVDPEATGELPAIGGTDVDLDLDDLTAALKVSDMGGDTVEQFRDDATVEQPRPSISDDAATQEMAPDDLSEGLHEARTMTEVGTKLDLARAYVDMGDPAGARSILEEVLDEGDEAQRQQAKQLLDSLPS
ncbi:MAG: FimV/HubP family polar landmark protein, partial [Woeseiaceae bacterium]|nr:FimV/HubP family polar landmark protein [Woeseiaceae bacterium]